MDRRKHLRRDTPANLTAAKKNSAPTKIKPVPKTVPWWPVLTIIALSILVYIRTAGYHFTLDDYSLILENKSTQKGLGAIKEFFTTGLRYGYIFASDDLFRPLSKSLYAFEWSLSPGNAVQGHLINIFLFTLTCILVFKTLFQWTGSLITAFLSAAFFAVLPVHTEVVANIKSADEILGLLLGLLCLRSIYNYSIQDKTSDLLKGLIWFLLALMSKESSVTLLAVIPLVTYFFTEQKGKKIWLPVLSALAVALLYFIYRSHVLGPVGISLKPSASDNMLAAAPGWLTAKTTAVYLLGRYLLILFTGYPLSFDNSFPALPFSSFTDWKFLISALCLVTLLLYAALRFRKKDHLSFAILFFFITASVSSNIFITIGTSWGERLMYLPSFGFCLGLAVLLERYTVKSTVHILTNKLTAGITVILLLTWGSVAFSRTAVWKDNETLYKSGLESAPNSCRVQYYLGNYYVKEEQLTGKSPAERDSILDLAIHYLERAVQLYPSFTDAYNQMGLGYFRMNKYDAAEKAYLKGLTTNNLDPVIHNNLGTCYFNTKRYEEALKEFTEAVRINPRYAEAWGNQGSVLGAMGNYDAALNSFNQSVSADPNYAMGWYFMGLTWRYKGDENKAGIYLDKAKALNPAL